MIDRSGQVIGRPRPPSKACSVGDRTRRWAADVAPSSSGRPGREDSSVSVPARGARPDDNDTTTTGERGMTAPKDATEATRAANRDVLARLPFSDRRDFDDAAEGLVAPLPDDGVITDGDGQVVWDLSRFAFLADETTEAPDTVNPSLWRQSQLVVKGGLYKVVDRLYQVRSADLSNLTIVEGDTGLIVFDPLISVETARAAMELYFQHRPRKPVVAVVHSHSHVDHYGGVRGVVSEDDVKAGKVMIIAPVGFLQAAVAENVFAGNTMSRRASYMYGNLLAPGPTGSGRRRPRHDHVERHRHVDPADPRDHRDRPADEHRRPRLRVPARPRHRSAGRDALVHRAARARCARRRTAATRCTTPTRCAAHRSATRRRGRSTSRADRPVGRPVEVMYGMHHWPVWGNDRVHRDARPRPATATATSTTRRCASPTTGTRRSRSPSRSSSRPSWPTTGRCAPTTGRSTTTSRPPTRSTSAGSTATRPTSTPTRPSTPPRSTSR